MMYSTLLFFDPFSILLLCILAIYLGIRHISKGIEQGKSSYGGRLKPKTFDKKQEYYPYQMASSQQPSHQQQQSGAFNPSSSSTSTMSSQSSSSNINSFLNISPTQANVISYIINKIFGSALGSIRFTIKILSILLPFIRNSPSYRQWSLWIDQQLNSSNPEVQQQAARTEQQAQHVAQNNNNVSSSSAGGMRQRPVGNSSSNDNIPPPTYEESWSQKSIPLSSSSSQR